MGEGFGSEGLEPVVGDVFAGGEVEAGYVAVSEGLELFVCVIGGGCGRGGEDGEGR